MLRRSSFRSRHQGSESAQALQSGITPPPPFPDKDNRAKTFIARVSKSKINQQSQAGPGEADKNKRQQEQKAPTATRTSRSGEETALPQSKLLKQRKAVRFASGKALEITKLVARPLAAYCHCEDLDDATIPKIACDFCFTWHRSGCLTRPTSDKSAKQSEVMYRCLECTKRDLRARLFRTIKYGNQENPSLSQLLRLCATLGLQDPGSRNDLIVRLVCFLIAAPTARFDVLVLEEDAGPLGQLRALAELTKTELQFLCSGLALPTTGGTSKHDLIARSYTAMTHTETDIPLLSSILTGRAHREKKEIAPVPRKKNGKKNTQKLTTPTKKRKKSTSVARSKEESANNPFAETLSWFTCAQLREECRMNGLSYTGNKGDLVLRLAEKLYAEETAKEADQNAGKGKGKGGKKHRKNCSCEVCASKLQDCFQALL
eukprot:gb/GEZN01007497.1/.p1 GENE.gb/GEZN01007497.1/~~gb/GEZN01007497.1/.p1  ORF type:complete len:432 (+),score=68.50 gb/GEZN01007497.1/:29-1324(+)